MADFFVSYTSTDRAWAEWIAFVLEEGGFSTVIQAWDFRPGANFVLEMQRATAGATRTIMVLSPDYLKSQFASAEWASALADDPNGLEHKLLPVMVRECKPEGLLHTIVRIELTGLDEEAARSQLLAGTGSNRAKPSRRPAFPSANAPERKAFPGSMLEKPASDWKADVGEPEPAHQDADRSKLDWPVPDAIQLLWHQLLSFQRRAIARVATRGILLAVVGIAAVILIMRWLACKHLTSVMPAKLWLNICS